MTGQSAVMAQIALPLVRGGNNLLCTVRNYVCVWLLFLIENVVEYRAQIMEGEKDFEELASKESDCSSAKRGGDLGHFTRGKMQKSFEDASYLLLVMFK